MTGISLRREKVEILGRSNVFNVLNDDELFPISAYMKFEEYNEGDDSQEVEVHVVLVREIHYLHTKASPSKKPGKNPPWRTFFLRRLTLRKQKEIQKPDCNYHLK